MIRTPDPIITNGYAAPKHFIIMHALECGTGSQGWPIPRDAQTRLKSGFPAFLTEEPWKDTFAKIDPVYARMEALSGEPNVSAKHPSRSCRSDLPTPEIAHSACDERSLADRNCYQEGLVPPEPAIRVKG